MACSLFKLHNFFLWLATLPSLQSILQCEITLLFGTEKVVNVEP